MAVLNAGHELILRALVCIVFLGAVAIAQTLSPGEVRITSGPYQPSPRFCANKLISFELMPLCAI